MTFVDIVFVQHFVFIGYVEKLMTKTINLSEEGKESTVTEVVPRPLCAAYEHPSKSIAIQQHKSRFSSTKK